MRLRTLWTCSHTRHVCCTLVLPWIRTPVQWPSPSSCNYNCSPSPPHPTSSPALSPLFCGSFLLPPYCWVCLGQGSGPVERWGLADGLRGEEPIAGKVESVLGEWAVCILVLAWENEAVHWEAEQLFCFTENKTFPRQRKKQDTFFWQRCSIIFSICP